MTQTGPQKYGPASLAYWYQDRYPGSAMESNVGVLHTTEGTVLPSYSGGASAPNFTALPDIPNKRLRWYQHFDFDVSSRALVNLAGGVETNTLNAVQVELVGTCDPKYKTSWGTRRAGVDYLYWPEAPDWALAELGRFVKWAHDQHGIKLQSTVTWKAYPSSYGANGVRLSGPEWVGYYGWLGHQHVPENSHGDPGDINFARVLEHARGAAAPEEEDVALTSADVDKVAVAVLKKDGIIAIPGAPADNPTWTLSAAVTEVLKRLDKATASVAALTAANGKLVETVAKLAAGVGDLDPAAIVADLKTEITAAIESIDIRLDTADK